LDEKRRHPRFAFEGAALLVVEETPDGPVLVLTTYSDVSIGGASMMVPDRAAIKEGDLRPGRQVRLLSDREDRGRKATVVQMADGRLRLRLEGSDELTEFDLARLLEPPASGDQE
jgi:hypothetical protein